MAWCGPRTVRKKRRYNNRRSCCWNPVIVFLLTFVAIGSLRLRQRKPVLFHLRRSSNMQYQLTETSKLHDRPYQKYHVVNSNNNKAVTYKDWILQLSRRGGQNTGNFSAVLQSSPYDALYLELPPLTSESLKNAAEFVLLDAPELKTVTPDAKAFAQHFATNDANDVAVFANLGKDATLIVPKPLPDSSNYAHLKLFVQNAPESQIKSVIQMSFATFWKEYSLEKRQQQPLWLSTSGTGVSWLHFRVDTVPKYYQFDSYKKKLSTTITQQRSSVEPLEAKT